LAERQQIELDRPLTEYYMPTYLPDHPYIRKITARHVLTHTTGFPDWGTSPASLVPAFEPGKFFSYSGEGFFLLQLIVEKITGQSLQTFVRSTVFYPAGMTTSSFAMGADNIGKVAFGHAAGRVAPQSRRDTVERIKAIEAKWGKPSSDWLQDDWLRALAETDTKPQERNRVGHVNAAASLLTTAAEYAIFLSLLMEGTPSATWKISESMRRAMLSRQIAVQKNVPLWWGLGVAIERDGTNWRVGHEGNNDNNFLAYSGLDPANGRGLTILTNGGGGFGVYQRIVRAATGLDQLSFIATYHPRHDP
jgi:CubicO group peptidase (beta-lactamase class C family)